MLSAWCKIWIYYSFFNHFCMAQPVVSKLLHVIDFKKWFPVGVLRYRIYYGKIYIWQHSVYYSVPWHRSWTQWKMFAVVSSTLFQEKETQGDFLQEVLESGCSSITVPMGECFTSASRPSKRGAAFVLLIPLDFIQKYFFRLKQCASTVDNLCYLSEHYKEQTQAASPLPAPDNSYLEMGRWKASLLSSPTFFFLSFICAWVSSAFSQPLKGASPMRPHKKPCVG